MKRVKKINDILNIRLSDFTIEVSDKSYLHKGHNNFDGLGETHILINLRAKTSNKINRIKIHRYINELLIDEFTNGLHSLEIKINAKK